MTSINKILHATDFSPCSDAALEIAGALARAYGARMVILHVGRPPLQHLGAPVPMPPLPEEWGREELEQKLHQRQLPDLKPLSECQLEFDEDISGAILRIATEKHCDLIVVGTHGRTGLRRVLLGSVAEHVLRGAPCPVLTVRGLPNNEITSK